MSAAPTDPTRWPRRLLAVLFTWDLAHQLWSLHGVQPTLWLPTVGLAGIALAWWGLRHGGAAWPLIGAVACGAVVVVVHRGALWPEESAVYAGSLISAWVIGRLVARWLLRQPDAQAREAAALSAATATLGAMYVCAAASRFQLLGLASLDPDLLRRALSDVYEPTGHWPLNAWIVESRAAAAAVTGFTVLAELSGVLFLFGRRARALSACLLVCLHLITVVSTPVVSWGGILAVLVFGFSATPAGTNAERQPRSRVAVMLLALAALLAIPLTLHNSTGEQPPSEPEGPQLTHLGPVTRDQALPGDWKIRSMQWDKGVITIWLRADPSWARIDFWATGSRDRPYAREKDGVTASYVVHESVYATFAPVFDLLFDAVTIKDLADPLAPP